MNKALEFSTTYLGTLDRWSARCILRVHEGYHSRVLIGSKTSKNQKQALKGAIMDLLKQCHGSYSLEDWLDYEAVFDIQEATRKYCEEKLAMLNNI